MPQLSVATHSREESPTSAAKSFRRRAVSVDKRAAEGTVFCLSVFMSITCTATHGGRFITPSFLFSGIQKSETDSNR
jgi:hypothetical protein